MTDRSTVSVGVFARLAQFVERRPAAAVGWLLGLHLVLWSLVPFLASANLQLDPAEGLALGKEWQLGYWKHPPLPWWMADLAYRITGQIGTVYLLGPAVSVACMFIVWRFALTLAGPLAAFAATAALEGLHFFNYSAVKFGHDQMQLPFWALTGLFAYRAIAGGRLRDWVLAGAMLALAFWAKYAALLLGITIALVLVFDAEARRSWRTAGPYAMAAAFLLVLSPHLWWLVTNDFIPLRYVDLRAETASRWYQHLTFPLQWIASQAFFLLPAAMLLGLLHVRGHLRRRRDIAPFAQRFLAALALGPFLVTALGAALLGRMPVSMWGYPFWIFAPLALIVWFEPDFSGLRIRRFVCGVAGIFLIFLTAFVLIVRFGPLVRPRSVTSHFPGHELARIVTTEWHKRTGTALHYVSGTSAAFGPGEFAANNIAVYSPDRPRVIVHGEFRKSPWIDPEDVRRRGAVIVWEPSRNGQGVVADIKRVFPRAEVQPQLVLQSQSRFARTPFVVYWAFVPPQGSN